jgi:hypothetical protein
VKFILKFDRKYLILYTVNQGEHHYIMCSLTFKMEMEKYGNIS